MHAPSRDAPCMPGKGAAQRRQGGEGSKEGGVWEGRWGGGLWAAWPGPAWPWCRHANRPLLAPSARPPLSLITFSHSHTHKLMLLIDFLLLRPICSCPCCKALHYAATTLPSCHVWPRIHVYYSIRSSLKPLFSFITHYPLPFTILPCLRLKLHAISLGICFFIKRLLFPHYF